MQFPTMQAPTMQAPTSQSPAGPFTPAPVMQAPPANGLVSFPRPWAWALWVLTLTLACSPGQGVPGKAYHLLVISLGSLDDKDLDNLDPQQHPNLTQWLNTSTRYTNFLPQGTDALANLASLFTGLEPSEHGANLAGDSPLKEGITPLAAYLIEHTYNPGAVVPAEPALDPKYGLAQGFREYEILDGDAASLALLGVDWIEHHVKQPFLCFVALPSGGEDSPVDLKELDAALGELLRCMAEQGVLQNSLVAVTAHTPRTPGQSLPLMIRSPRQSQPALDPRHLSQVHLCQLILREAALPVAAVRPAIYLTHPLPEGDLPKPEPIR